MGGEPFTCHTQNSFWILFVRKVQFIYGKTFCTYNVHALRHIHEDVEYFGVSLNDVSAFKFETICKRLSSLSGDLTIPSNFQKVERIWRFTQIHKTTIQEAKMSFSVCAKFMYSYHVYIIIIDIFMIFQNYCVFNGLFSNYCILASHILLCLKMVFAAPMYNEAFKNSGYNHLSSLLKREQKTYPGKERIDPGTSHGSTRYIVAT